MATYGNRTDLQNPTKKIAVTAATGQTYGEAGAQRAAQQAVPMGAPQAPVIAPGSLGNLDRPTERPMEPVTAGNPLGMGPGAEALVPPMPADYTIGSRQDLIDQVRYVYSKYPNSAVFQLLLDLENQQIK